MTQLQDNFLHKAYTAASEAGHIFPEYAACEAALESAWGQSRLTASANNLFGQKQSHPPLAGTTTITMQTREYLDHQWVVVDANWVKFPSWVECFRARMDLLKRLSRAYPHYAAALSATSGEEFTVEVSKSWSTDPARAEKVIEVYKKHEMSNMQRIDTLRAKADFRRSA